MACWLGSRITSSAAHGGGSGRNCPARLAICSERSCSAARRHAATRLASLAPASGPPAGSWPSSCASGSSSPTRPRDRSAWDSRSARSGSTSPTCSRRTSWALESRDDNLALEVELVDVVLREGEGRAQQEVVALEGEGLQPPRVEALVAGLQRPLGHCVGGPDREVPEVGRVPEHDRVQHPLLQVG